MRRLDGKEGNTLDNERLAAVARGTLRCGPETLQLNLTNACRLRCAFCWNHSPLLAPPSARWRGQHLSRQHLKLIIEDLPRLRPSQVLLSGRGEPLLFPQVEELLSALQQQHLPVTIQTAGADGPPPARLAALGVDQLLVNLSAGTEESYARTHPGSSVSLAQVRQRLEQAALAGIHLALVAVIQKTNQDDLHALLELAQRLGARLMLKGMEPRAGLEELALAGAEREVLRQQLADLLEQAQGLGIEVDASHFSQLLQARKPTASFTDELWRGPCYMGWYYLRVTCDGQVMFCCKDKRMGHLDQRSLYAIWRSAAYHLQRLAGRDGDLSTGLFSAKCRNCSNFAKNRQLARLLAAR